MVLAVAVAIAILWSVCIAPYLEGYPLSDSYYFNTAWIALFADQFRSGDIYPRWLADFSNEIGAPIFYFYGPAPFHLAAIVNFLTGGGDFERTLSAANVGLYLFSAGSFLYFARNLAGVRVAVLCATFYAAAPYHVIDLEVRGALGEAAAYVFMPLALHGMIPPAATARRAVGAIGYAGLLFSHLPSAVLFTLAFVVFATPQFLSPARRREAVVTFCFIGGAGALIAAAYLLPALTLGRHLVPNGWLSVAGAYYFPENWLHFGPTELGPDADRVRLGFTAAQAISTAGALSALAVLAVARRLLARQAALIPTERREIAIGAAAAAAFCWLMMTEFAAPLYKTVEPLRLVQFPWRIGVVIDLMSATLVAIAASRIIEFARTSKDRLAAGAVMTSGGVLSACGIIVLVQVGTAIGSIERTTDHRRSLDAEISALILPSRSDPAGPEWLFAEYPGEYRSRWIVESDAYALDRQERDERKAHADAFLRWRAAVASLPPVWIENNATAVDSIAIRKTGPTHFEISVAAVQPAIVRVRRAYFPGWAVISQTDQKAVEVWGSKTDGLIAFKANAGTHVYKMRRIALPPERVGGWISAATFLAVLAVLAWTRFGGATGSGVGMAPKIDRRRLGGREEPRA